MNQDTLKLIFEFAPVGIYMADIDGNCLHVNPTWCTISGMSLEQALGSGWQKAIHPDDRETVFKAWQTSVETGQPFQCSYRFLKPDGNSISVIGTANRQTDADGNTLAFIGTITNVSPQLKTEPQPHIKDAVITNPIDAFSMSDTEGYFTYVNQAFIELWQLNDSRQATGKNSNEFFINPNDTAEVMHQLQLNDKWQGELLARRADGTSFVCQVSAYAVRNSQGQLLSMMSSFIDISDKIASENDHKRERNFINAIFENAGTLMLVLTKLGHIVRFNHSCEDFSGYDSEEVFGHKVWDLFLPEEDVEAVKTIFNKLAFDAIPNKYENHWLTRDGQRRLISWHNSIVKNEAGEVEYIIASGIDITKQRATELALQQHKASLTRAQQIAKIGNWDWDIVSGELSWSDEIFRIFGIAPQAFPATYDAFLSYIHPDDRQRVIDAVNASITNHAPYSIDHRVLHPNGIIRQVHEEGMVYYDANGKANHMVGTVQDITRQKAAEDEKLKLSKALEQTADSVVITDLDGVIEFVNPAFSETTGYSKDEAIGNTPRLVKSNKHEASVYEQMWQALLAGNIYRNVIINRKKDGNTYFEEKTITPLKNDNGEITHFISTGKDITSRMQTQEHLYHLAHHDALTNLPNRTLFMDRLTHALTRSTRENKQLSVLFLDLDQFKKINDTLGHNTGDKLLTLMAQRLEKSVRSEDTIARLGGDEFAILLEQTDASHACRHVADKIISSMTSPFKIDERELFCTTSIGISSYPEDGKDSETLLKNADAAMYKAKDSGRNNYRFYSSEMNSRAFERLNLETGLRYALERNEFILYYQPLVDANNNIKLFEALLRWNHPQLGLIYPDAFIPLLEETGMIVAVGDWVLQTACLQASSWHTSGHNQLRIAVNMSSRQFAEHDLCDKVWKALQQAKLSPSQLEIEITENTLMDSGQQTIDSLWRLNKMGVGLALDDFGTGYSSLSYLKKYPIDTIKIDRSFLNDTANKENDIILIRAITNLAKNLNLQCVAEGVENESQLDIIKSCGCDLIQGFLFSKPIPQHQATEMLQAIKTR